MERLVYFTGDVALVDNLGIEECMAIQEPLKKLHKYENLEEQCHKQNYFSISHLLDKWECFLDEVHELLEYRRLEEQGLLLRLPCKVGDNVYRIGHYGSYIETCSITGFAECDSIKSMTYTVYIDPDEEDGISLSEFGKTVFLTKEEAEQKLEDLRGNEHGTEA